MNNLESGSMLVDEAQKVLFSDASDAFKRGSYNMVIRRAQEVVELSLKGILKVMGIEYPKVHDIGKLFVEQTLKKFPEADKDALGEIRDISTRLSEDREPSFYFERLYTREDARKALEDAEFVFGFVKILLSKTEPLEEGSI